MKNLNFLKDQMTYLGFGDKTITDALEKAINQGHERFSLTVKPQSESLLGNKSKFELNFNKSEKSGLYFFNNFKTTLVDKTENPIRSQLFHNNGTKGVTAKESINLLEGRSVKTVLQYNDKESKVFTKLDFNETNKNGNFKYRSFSENYGVDTKDILSNSGLKVDEKNIDNLVKSLEKGNLVKSDFLVKGKEVSGYVALNPEFKNLDHFDEDLKKVYSKNLGEGQKISEKESHAVSVSVDIEETPSVKYAPVVVARLSEKQTDKVYQALGNTENKFPSVTPKQLATVPIKVDGIDLTVDQRRTLLYGLSVEINKEKMLFVNNDTKELNLTSLGKDGEDDTRLISKTDVVYNNQQQALKPFESTEDIPERSNSISR